VPQVSGETLGRLRDAVDSEAIKMWIDLRHAYGPASNLPDLLARARTDVRPGHVPEGVWFQLWSALYHQGDVFTASYAAVPYLVAIARQRGLSESVDPLFLTGCIELGRLEGRGPQIPSHLEAVYHSAIAEAKILTEEFLEAVGTTDPHLELRGTLAALKGDVNGARAIFDADVE